MTEDGEKRIRTIFKEEFHKAFRAALGVDRTDNDKLAAMPIAEYQKYARGKKAEAKAARLARESNSRRAT